MKRYLVAGLLVWVPLGITLWVLHTLIGALDQTMLVLPESLRPEHLIGIHVPGLGVVLSFVILFATGVIAANFFGQRLIQAWEAMLGRIPFVKTIYASVKQVSDTLLSEKSNAFRKALLVEFPREGCWTIGFLTGAPDRSVAPHLPGEHVSVYVPTTPNPTGGYFVMLPRSRVQELEMTVDEAVKYVISMGVITPRGAAVSSLVPPAPPGPPPSAGPPALAEPATTADTRN
jgi:uncharacterized membrane protein